MKGERQILFYKDYFISFYQSLSEGAQRKLDYSLAMLKLQERVSKKFVKFIRDGIYEVRANHDGNIYRAFFIFDDGNIVMLFNGFQKKTQKKRRKAKLRKQFRLKTNIMQERNDIGSFDAILDKKYGKIGTQKREEFHRKAYAYCMGRMLMEARKQESMSQSELAAKVGTNKTYISRIERGLIEPGIGMFCQIANALGMRLEMVKSM